MSKIINVAVLSGGGSRGCIQAGMLDALYAHDPDLAFDIICGVSVGALNGTLLAHGATPREQRAYLERLKQIYFRINGPQDIYLKKGISKLLDIPGVVDDALGAAGTRSLYDAAPLARLVYENVNYAKLNKSGVALRVGVTSLLTGEFKSVAQNDKYLAEFVIASAAIPAIFPPVSIKGEMFVDGGVRNIAPLSPAFKAIRERYKEGDEVNVYLLLCSALKEEVVLPSELKDYFQILLRSLDVMASEIYRNDIQECEYRNEIGTWIPVNLTVIAPEKNMMTALDFYPTQIAKGYQYGVEVTQKVLRNRKD